MRSGDFGNDPNPELERVETELDPETRRFFRDELMSLRYEYRRYRDNPPKIARVKDVDDELERLAEAAREMGEALNGLSAPARDWLLDARPSGAIYDPGNRDAPADLQQRQDIERIFAAFLPAFRDRVAAYEREMLEGSYLRGVRQAVGALGAAARDISQHGSPAEHAEITRRLQQASRAQRLRRHAVRLPPRPSPHAMVSEAAETALVLEGLARRVREKFRARWRPRRGPKPEMQDATPEAMVVRQLMEMILQAFGIGGFAKVTVAGSQEIDAEMTRVGEGNKFSSVLITFEGFVDRKDTFELKEPRVFGAAAKEVAKIRDAVIAKFREGMDRNSTASPQRKRGRPPKPRRE